MSRSPVQIRREAPEEGSSKGGPSAFLPGMILKLFSTSGVAERKMAGAREGTGTRPSRAPVACYLG